MSFQAFTPMQKQYQEIKKNHLDAILFFRLGDFYEMFGDDAILASKILGIVLTKRNRERESEMPMCGIPYHSADSYIDKLVKSGYKVAICEQVSDPTLPGIVERKVIDVITPGTTLSTQLLDLKKNNYLAVVFEENKFFSLSYADLGTGDFFVTATNNIELIRDELFRIEPTELIFETSSKKTVKDLYPDNVYIFEYTKPNDAEVKLEEYFASEKDNLLWGENSETSALLRKSAATILSYFVENKMTQISHLKIPTVYYLDDYIHIDDATLRNLEILRPNFSNAKDTSLLKIIDQTLTSMGGRKLREFIVKPILDPEKLIRRYEAVENFLAKISNLNELRNCLKNIPDVERILGKISLNKANAKDLLYLKNFISDTDLIKKELANFTDSKIVQEILIELANLSELFYLLDSALVENPPLDIKDGGMIKKGFNQELDGYLDLLENGNKLLLELQVKEQKRTGIDSLKIRFNQIFGYYIEITKAKLKELPADYIRKQTLVSSERFTTEELKILEEKILNAEEKSKRKEYEIFLELRDKCLESLRIIQNNSEKIAYIDIYQSFAFKAYLANYTKPILSSNNILRIEEGRHPVISEILDVGKFISNDTYLSEDTNFIQLLTGPNMSGKSTYLRQVALIVLLAQIGSFVPVKILEFHPVDCIFTRVGASDNLSRGQSTFMVEMQETAYILKHATKNSLIILDEVGRGTSTYDGLSLAWSILEYLHEKIRAKTIFATHYHELIAVAGKLQFARNISVEVREKSGRVIFLYNIKDGGINKSYGIFVAKLAGLPDTVLKRAIKILGSLELSSFSPSKNFDLNQQNLFSVDNKIEEVKEADDDLVNQDLVYDLIKELKELSVDDLTPIEAINLLNEIKKKYYL